MRQKTQTPHIIVFVEGDTDKVFFDALLSYYRDHSATKIFSCEVKNLKGVSRYTSKVVSKLENEIIPKAKSKGMVVKTVCCSYDTDVFEFGERPIVDWSKVQREVKRLGIKDVYLIGVESSIEDWLLDDKDGLCRYLGLKTVPEELIGNDGNQKMLNLFKKANKVYIKGDSARKFIQFLDFKKIRDNRSAALRELEIALNVTLK